MIGFTCINSKESNPIIPVEIDQWYEYKLCNRYTYKDAKHGLSICFSTEKPLINGKSYLMTKMTERQIEDGNPIDLDIHLKPSVFETLRVFS